MATKVKEAVANVVASPNHSNPLISNAKLKQLYSTMLKCRLLQERAQILTKHSGSYANYYAGLGHEATAVGAGIDLRPHDTVIPSNRDLILNFIKGTPLTVIFSRLYGRSTSPNGTPAHSGCAPLNIITPASEIDSQLNIGTDIALGNQMKKTDNVVIAFFSEGSSSLGPSHQTMNFGGIRKLPIIYVCQDGVRAESTSARSRRKMENVSLNATGLSFPTIAVDVNDVVAIYRVAQEAIERARSGGGPTLIEAKAYRWLYRSQLTPAKYRAVEELEESKDPIAAMESYLIGKGLFSNGWKKIVSDEFHKELDAAIEIAEKTPSPETAYRLDYVSRLAT